jgi:fructose-1,6-bisphosphatase/inositol monophosphatase family enzyme
MTELMTAIADIVRSAGDVMRAAFTAPDKPAYSLKGRQDYLTATDGAVEQFVREQIEKRFPGDKVLGEEGGGSVDGTRLWIVDPIDGTANFARQIPHYCISLGLMVDGRLEAGALYEPMHDELFIAERGQGAWLNGNACRSAAWRRSPRPRSRSAGRPASRYRPIWTWSAAPPTPAARCAAPAPARWVWPTWPPAASRPMPRPTSTPGTSPAACC